MLRTSAGRNGPSSLEGKVAPAESKAWMRHLSSGGITVSPSTPAGSVLRCPGIRQQVRRLRFWKGACHWFGWFNWPCVSLICRTQPAAAFLCPLMRFSCCKICGFHFQYSCHFSRNSFPLNAVTMAIASINRGKHNPTGQACRCLLRWSRPQRRSTHASDGKAPSHRFHLFNMQLHINQEAPPSNKAAHARSVR